MLAYNPKQASHCAGDQAILNLVQAVSEQATLFYQRAGPLLTDINIRRYFFELELLHQQARKLVSADNINVATDQDICALCQWYREQNPNLTEDITHWLAEVLEQLRRQLRAFKRLIRELAQTENVKALANLTAGLQIIADQLSPLLLNRKI